MENYRKMVQIILCVFLVLVKVDSLSAIIINKQIVEKSVLEYGAKGDGVHDDSEAFQRAISSMNPTERLFIPKGNYLITKTLKVNKSNIKIYGQGNSSKLIYRYGKYSVTKSTIQSFLLEKASDITFSNFSVDGGAKTFNNTRIDDYGKEVWDVYGAYNIFFIHPAYNNAVRNIIFKSLNLSNSYFSAIHCYGRLKDQAPKFYSSNLSILDCTFNNIGIHAVGFNYTRSSSVKNNNIKNVGLAKLINDSGSGLGIDVSAGCENISVEGNTIDGAGGGIKCETHLESNGRFVTSKNIFIKNNIIKNLYGVGKEGYDIFYGIRINGENCIVESNDIESFSHGIIVGLNAKSCLIQNNLIRSTKSSLAAGIRCDKNAGLHRILGNTIKNTGAQGILVANSSNITIANNLILNSRLDNIRVLGGTGIKIEDNICASAGANNISIFPTKGMKISDVLLDNNICYDLDGTLRDRSERIKISNSSNIKDVNNKLLTSDKVKNKTSSLLIGNLTMLSSVPKIGVYKRGDIVIKKHSKADLKKDNLTIGWKCIESGNPGRWRIISAK